MGKGIKKYIGLVLLMMGMGLAAHAQSPNVNGAVTVGLSSGSLSGNLCMTNLLKLDSYAIVLHRGLNVASFTKNGEALVYGGFYGGEFVDEGVKYTLRESFKAKDELCVSYTGGFPVFMVDEGEKNVLDWKGNIAFNGKSIRATEQSKWYPILMDPNSGQTWKEVTYEIAVDCEECNSIYVNGSAPQKGPQAVFTSEVPRVLLILAGDIDFTEAAGLYFVNGNVGEEQAQAIKTGIAEISAFFEDYLDIAYDDNPTFMSFASVSKDRKINQSTWGFNSWPSIGLDGRLDFNTLIGEDGTIANWIWSSLSHEMGHYYFGTVLVPRGVYSWFFIEGTTEYLALKAVQALKGEKPYTAKLKNYYNSVSRMPNPTPFHKITEREQLDGTYRYRLAPMYLVALEDYIGKERVQEALSRLLKAKDGDVVYADFMKAAVKAGASKDDIRRFEAECLEKKVTESCLTKWAGD